MKKILAMMLTAAMMLSMGTAAMAVNQDASFTKTYKSTNGEANPAETFTFTYTAYDLTDSNANLDVGDMPEIPNSTVTFEAGEATAEGLGKAVEVALADINWPGVGVYYYNVDEVDGNTLGVTYDQAVAKLKVTVAYDEGTDTYYTAFVTLSLADDDNDGYTDVKTAGFNNIYNAGDLTIKKLVSGNLADTQKPFEVTVTFSNNDTNGNVVKSVITYTDDGADKTIVPTLYYSNFEKVEADDGTVTYVLDGGEDAEDVVLTEAEYVEATKNITEWDGTGDVSVKITVKHDETIEFSNIPYGVTYDVVEADYTAEANGAYQAAKYSLNDQEATTTPVDNEPLNGAKENVVITNTKSTDVDTGISVDSIPYIAMLGVVAVGGAGFMVSKKRRSED